MRRFLPFLAPSDGHRDELEASCHSESGDTLVEVLIALVVIGVASLSIVLAFSTSIWGSADYRVTATVDTALRSAAEESTTTLDQLSPTIWGTCSDASTEQSQLQTAVQSVLPSVNYTATESIAYWNGQSFTGTCVANAAQQITVTVSYKGTAYSITTVVDDPVMPTIAVGVTAAKLAFVEQPASSGIAAGSTLSPWPMVAIEDVNSKVVQDDLSAATLTVWSNGQSTGQTCAGIENLGVFTFSSCVITATGTYTLQATDGSLTSATTSAFTVGASVPTKLAFTTSPPATTGAGATFSVVVAEEDSYGNTETGDSSTSVSLAANNGNGSGGFACTTTPTQFTTGVATFAGCYYTVASTTAYTLTATSGILFPANATTTVSAGTANKLLFTTSPTNSVAGSALATQPQVTVEDAYGNVVTTDASTASLAITPGTPTSGGPGALTGCTQSETNGVISFTGCEINIAGVGYELTATDGSLIAANSSAFNVTAGSANKLLFTTSPTNSVAGSALATQPQVTVEDAHGNVVTTDSSTASLSITSGTPNSGGPGALTGCTQSETNGVISFTGCEINTAGVGYELTTTDGSLTAANSSAFNVTAGSASKLVFTTSPVAAASGAAFSTQPKVTVEDAYGNVVTSFSSAIALTAPTGTLSSCGSPTPSSGVVTWTSCTFAGTVGTSYTLTASYTGLTSATSASFTPTGTSGTVAYKLVFTTSPVAAGTGAAFSTQPVVKVENKQGNVVTTFSSAITLTASGGTLSSCGGLTASSGVVTVTGCTFTGTAGTPYTLTASSGTLISGTSASFSPTGAGSANKLVFTTSPTNSVAGSALATQPQVTVEDAHGNVVTTDSSTASLAITSGTPNSGGPGALTGCTQSETNGVISFTGCEINTAGVGYELTATDGSLTAANSSAFNVTGGS